MAHATRTEIVRKDARWDTPARSLYSERPANVEQPNKSFVQKEPDASYCALEHGGRALSAQQCRECKNASGSAGSFKRWFFRVVLLAHHQRYWQIV